MTNKRSFSMRLDSTARAYLEEAAEKDRRSLSSLIETILVEWIRVRETGVLHHHTELRNQGRENEAKVFRKVAGNDALETLILLGTKREKQAFLKDVSKKRRKQKNAPNKA